MFKKAISVNGNDFTTFVVCPKCHSVYTLDEAVTVTHDASGKVLHKKSNKCCYVSYPRHPQKRFRSKCDTVLMKTVIGKDGKEFIYPKRKFCYRSLIASVSDLFKRPGFKESCEKWRQRDVKEGVYADIFDGQVWKDFQVHEGKPYLQEPGNLAFMLNVDWFQPYKNINDSVGVMYLAVMNLPREERFKKDNIIVVGLIPGPHEPKEHINVFLEPFVSDLKQLWAGLNIDGQFVRGALLSLASDIPAARKTGGFLGHMAKKGCSKCLKDFPRTVDNKVDYSGYDDAWPIRTNQEHCRYAREAKRAINKATKTKIEGKYGARYSCLQELLYFDVVRLHVIDPMHNLLEGTAKRVMQVWKERGAISKEGFATIQERVNSLKLPSNIDSGIPSKIEAAFEGFTAAQWKLWVCVYSTFALKGVIGEEDYRLWRLFVAATQLLCSRVIDNVQVEDAHRCLQMFCRSFENRYGKQWCTMNMHLHLHLKKCVKDFGPVHGFWCFSFERANGTLGDYHTNNQDTEVIMMRKWLVEWQIAGKPLISLGLLDGIDTEVETLFRKTTPATAIQAEKLHILHDLAHDHISHGSFELDCTIEALLPPVKKCTMSISENSDLLSMFKAIYQNERIERVSINYMYSNRYSLVGDVFSTSRYRTGSSSFVTAKWLGVDGVTGDPIIDPNSLMRPGEISNIWKVFLFLWRDDCLTKHEHAVAKVNWYKEHGDKWHYGQNGNCTVWETNEVPWSYASFLPLKRIASQCARCTCKVDFSPARQETVNVLVTLPSARCV